MVVNFARLAKIYLSQTIVMFLVGRARVCNVIWRKLMKLVLFCLMFVSVQTDEWKPPKNPDPDKILTQARNDAQNGDFETALAKHVWFHENALAIQPSQYGVRLSFALSDWVELANKYPEARKKLEEIRDVTGKLIVEQDNVAELFHDYVSINSYLRENKLTVKLFERLDKDSPKKAASVANFAKDDLIAVKKIELLGKYLIADREFKIYLKTFNQLKPHFPNEYFVYKDFSDDVATLVAILAINGKKDKAKEIAKKAATVWEDDSFKRKLDRALKGKFPL